MNSTSFTCVNNSKICDLYGATWDFMQTCLIGNSIPGIRLLKGKINLSGGQNNLFGDQIDLFGDQNNLFGDQNKLV